MKKAVLYVLCLALLLAGCGGQTPESAAPAPTAEPPLAREMPSPAAEPAEAVALPTAEALAEGYLRPAGSFHPGTAGSSLSRARAACDALGFASGYAFDRADPEALRALLREALASISEAERGYFEANLETLAAEIELCRADWSGERGRYDDAGAAAEMAALLQNDAALSSWEALLKASRASVGLEGILSEISEKTEPYALSDRGSLPGLCEEIAQFAKERRRLSVDELRGLLLGAEGLNGEAAEAYAGMLAALHEREPLQFVEAWFRTEGAAQPPLDRLFDDPALDPEEELARERTVFHRIYEQLPALAEGDIPAYEELEITDIIRQMEKTPLPVEVDWGEQIWEVSLPGDKPVSIPGYTEPVSFGHAIWFGRDGELYLGTSYPFTLPEDWDWESLNGGEGLSIG